MKRFIFIFITLWLVLITCGCKNQHMPENAIVEKIETYSNGLSFYTTNGVSVGVDGERPSFVAKTGLYTIGDTVKFIK